MTTDTGPHAADRESEMTRSATRPPPRAGAAGSAPSALLYTALPGYGLDQAIAAHGPRLAHTVARLP